METEQEFLISIVQNKLKEAFIEGYIAACQEFTDEGFDQNCNDKMIEALEDWQPAE